MVYRFKLVSDEVSNFSREIEIDSENTFLQLRNSILESVGYTKDELDSFFLCGDDWEREEEITLQDMGNSTSDCDVWLMDNTHVSELVEEEGQKLVFEFDYFTQRCFFMELKEMIPNRTLIEPLYSIKRGNPPRQRIDMDEFEKKLDAKAQAVVEDIDLDSFDDSNFNEEELEEGFDIMSM